VNTPHSHRLLIASLVAFIAACPLRADWKDDVGYTRLQQTFTSGVPTSAADGYTQTEAPEGTNYAPDTTSALFSLHTFTFKSGDSTAIGHAQSVASYFYGNPSSLVPGPAPVDLYNADGWLNAEFLRYGTAQLPPTELRRVQNHSWISSDTLTDAQVTHADQRLDYAINRDGFTSVVGMGNGASTTLPGLLGQGYHCLSVGLVNGNHSAGFTAYDTAGRMKPDLVAFEGVTSFSTPQVASAAALISEKLRNTYSGSLSANSDYPRLTKALLLAGAAKEPLSSWSRADTTKPYDAVYGAGALNVFLAYRILSTGKQPASGTSTVSETGWDVNTPSPTKLYFFDIPAGTTSARFSAALTWHRSLTFLSGSFFAPALANLDLKLFTATGTTTGTQIDASLSTVDNIEHIYQATLAPGRYALQVSLTSGTNTTYALAWRTSPTVTVAPTTPVARELDLTPAVFTITRTGPITSPLFVPLTWSGTAITGTHYDTPPTSVLIPAGSAYSTVQITPIADNLAQGDRTVTLSVTTDFSLSAGSPASATATIQDKPFDAWRFTHFTTEELTDIAVSGDSADPDSDGLPNLLEYALGAVPKSSDAVTHTPMAGMEEGYLTLSYTRPNTVTDITYSTEWSPDLSTWSSGAGVVETVSSTDNGNGTTTVVARSTAALADTPRQFLRLRVTR
jgi:hypothetical protein